MNDDVIETKLLRREMRTARESHVCCCGKRIAKGERYLYEFGLVDGDPYQNKESVEHIHRGEE